MRHDSQRLGPRLLGAVALCCAWITVGCGVGEGSGRVSGTVVVTPRCKYQPTNPFNLQSDFFVGQPIDADPMVSPTFPQNQLIIRLQNSGSRVEDADVLMFWVFDSAAVARCIRGASPGGVDEWDPAVCDRTSPAVLGPKRQGRMYVGMGGEAVSSFFYLGASCPNANISADALGLCTDGSCPDVTLCPGRGSWINFTSFGNIPETDAIKDGYRVNDGDSIAARMDATGTLPAYHVELCDVATVVAQLDHILPIPKPRIQAVLEGYFDFKLERGQAGQPFP